MQGSIQAPPELLANLPKCVVRDLGKTYKLGFSGSEVMHKSRKMKNVDTPRGGKGKRKELRDTKKLPTDQKPGHRNYDYKNAGGKDRYGTFKTSAVYQGECERPDDLQLGDAPLYNMDEVLMADENYSAAGRANYIDPRRIPVHRYDPIENTPENVAGIIYGIRRTGKTFWLRWWMWHWKSFFWQVWIFTLTKINGFWEQFIPVNAVYPYWDEGWGEKILEFQAWVKKNPDEAKRQGYTDRSLVLFDDVISNKILRYAGDEGPYSSLYVEGRHYGTSVWTCTQKMTALPPKVRDNVDLAVIMKQTNDTDKERLWHEYMGRLNRRTAYQLIDLYTQVINPDAKENQKRYCLIIATDPALSYNERFFWSSPEDPGSFMMGSKRWKKDMGEEKLFVG